MNVTDRVFIYIIFIVVIAFLSYISYLLGEIKDKLDKD